MRKQLSHLNAPMSAKERASILAADYALVRSIKLEDGRTIEQDDADFPQELARVVIEECCI